MTTQASPAPQAIAKRPSVSPLYTMASTYDIEPENLMNTLRSTVIKATDKYTPTNEDVAVFVIVANQYGLNPFTREIYAFPAKGGGIVPVVGIDGWVTLVNRQVAFDGCEFEEEIDETGRVKAVTCVMHVKTRTFPLKITEHFSECVRPTEPWKGMPRRMLRHKAYIQAARYAFGLSGIYDEDEANDIAFAPKQVSTLPNPGAVAASDLFKPKLAAEGNGQAKPAPAIQAKETEPSPIPESAKGDAYEEPAKPDSVQEPQLAEGEIANTVDLELVRSIRSAIKNTTVPFGFGTNSIEQQLHKYEFELGDQCAKLWEELNEKRLSLKKGAAK